MSDAICRLATGGGLATRELYTDEEQMMFDAKRPVLMNGIEEIAHRGDLLDRCILLYALQIKPEDRVSESVFWGRFEREHPRILGAVLDAVSVALANFESVELERLPRMADFARWAVAAEPMFDAAPGAFLEAYEENRAAVNTLALEASAVAVALVGFMKDRAAWQGTAGDLLKLLNDRVDPAIQKARGWPTSGRGMSGALRRAAPNLRAEGMDIQEPGPNDRPREWRIRWTDDPTVGGPPVIALGSEGESGEMSRLSPQNTVATVDRRADSDGPTVPTVKYGPNLDAEVPNPDGPTVRTVVSGSNLDDWVCPTCHRSEPHIYCSELYENDEKATTTERTEDR
jgi:hypothetical protein